MSDTPPRVARPRGRPRKDAQLAPTDEVMASAIDAFSVHGYNGVSLRTVNDELGVSRNLLYQRFGSKAKLWRAAVDWAFRPLVEHLEAADDESADPTVRLRVLTLSFIEYSATRPYLARLVGVEGASSLFSTCCGSREESRTSHPRSSTSCSLRAVPRLMGRSASPR
jgi:AcrR family transcriptional regulator